MNNKQSGSTVLLVLSILATISVCIGASLAYTQTINRNVQRTVALQQATEIGDGSIELAFAAWRKICRAQPNVPLPTNSFSSIPLPSSSNFPAVPNFSASRSASSTATISNFTVQAVDPQFIPVSDPAAAPQPATGRDPGAVSFYYLASADVSLPALSAPVVAKVRRVFQKEFVSPWNWAIFYNDPLEIHPGPPFTVTGWVHTNETLYTAHSSLTFGSKSTYSDDWYTGFMPGDGAHTGETPVAPNWPSNLPPTQKIAQQPFGIDPATSFSTTDTNPNNDGYHEYLERPVSGYSDPFVDPDTGESVRYYDQAGVKILVDASNNVTIKNSAGVTVSAASTGADLVLYNTFRNAISTNSSIQDNREQATVRLVNLDVSVVTNAISAGTLQNFNRIIYVSDTSADVNGGSPKRGVRLKNGAIMPTGGLTVASSNPVYIQGDYNTGKTASSQPPSNTGNPSQPQVAGYTRQPSAVMGDAVMILSNAWSDANSFSGLSSRIATNTTVNAAIMAGIVSSANGNYSGGAENFPRFLENWSGGVTFTYYGSMVELFKSQQAIGNWGKSNVYNPPNRNWYFDTNFYTSPPPGTFTFINYNKHLWYLK